MSPLLVRGGGVARQAGLLLRHSAGWILAAYLLVPVLFKGWLQPFVPIDLTLLLALPTTAVGLFWLRDIRRDRHDRRTMQALALWGLLAALIVVGTTYAPDFRAASYQALYWVALAGIPLLAALPVARNPQQLHRFLVSFVGAGVLVTVLGLVQLPHVTAGSLEVLDTSRLGIARAVLFVPLIGIPLLAWRRRGLVPIVVLTATPPAVLVAVASGSRGPVIAFLALAGVLLLGALVRLRRGPVLRLTAALLIGSAVFFVGMSPLLPDHSLARFGLLGDAITAVLPDRDIPSQPEPTSSPAPTPAVVGPGPPPNSHPAPPDDLSDEPGGASIAVRAKLFSLALAMFLDSPVGGHGTASFAVVAARTPELGLFTHPHNLIAQFAAEFGAIGLTVLLLTVFASLRNWRIDRRELLALTLVLAFLALNALLSNGIYENRLLWAVWLLVLAGHASGRDTRERPVSDSE